MLQCEFVGYEEDGVQDTHPKDVALQDAPPEGVSLSLSQDAPPEGV